MRTLSILHGYTVHTVSEGPAILRSESPVGDMLPLPDPDPVSSYIINMVGPVPPVGTAVLTANVHAVIGVVFRSPDGHGHIVQVDVVRAPMSVGARRPGISAE